MTPRTGDIPRWVSLTRALGHAFGVIPGWYVLLIEPFARRCTTVVDVGDRGVRFELDLSEFVQRKHYWRAYERRELAFLRRWLRPGDLAVDVGANVGLLTITAGKAVGEAGLVVAIEPVPVNMSRLTWNIALNPALNVHPITIAVGAETSVLRLGIEQGQKALNNLGLYSASSNSNVIEVDVQPLDEVLKPFIAARESARLLKVDVEGMEPDVLRGASNLLAEHRIDAVMLEINPRFPTAATLRAVLEGAGYAIYRLGFFGRLRPHFREPSRTPGRTRRRLAESGSSILQWISGFARLTTVVAVPRSDSSVARTSLVTSMRRPTTTR